MDTLYEDDYDVINNEGENFSERDPRIASFEGHNEIQMFKCRLVKSPDLLGLSPGITCRLPPNNLRFGNCFILFFLTQ